MRRRMMVPPPAQDWDVVWDYTMGLPEDNGFEKVISGNPAINMTSTSLSIFPSVGYVRYEPIGFEFCNEGIYEERIVFASFTSINGNRMILSNDDAGVRGLQIYMHSNSIKYQKSNGNIIANLNIGQEYIIRIERRNNVNYVYLDGEKIFESEDSNTQFAAGNRIFFQSGGEYFLKSIKFKKIS